MYLTKATEQLPRDNQITPEAINRGRTVKITLEDYMKACGMKDKKTAREQLNTAVKSLYAISLKWEEPEGKSGRKRNNIIVHEARIIDHIATNESGNPTNQGAAEIQLSYSMAEYLAGAYIMPYPSALFAINTQYHPYSIPFCWKLCSLYNVNFGRPQQGRTTVETLLRAAKGIPRYETMASKGKIYERIIAPFDRDMQELVARGILSYYYYYDDMGTRINRIAELNYLTFSGLNVRYELAGYPDQTPRIEAKQKRITAAIDRRKKAAAKKKTQAAAEGQPEQLIIEGALT